MKDKKYVTYSKSPSLRSRPLGWPLLLCSLFLCSSCATRFFAIHPSSPFLCFNKSCSENNMGRKAKPRGTIGQSLRKPKKSKDNTSSAIAKRMQKNQPYTSTTAKKSMSHPLTADSLTPLLLKKDTATGAISFSNDSMSMLLIAKKNSIPETGFQFDSASFSMPDKCLQHALVIRFNFDADSMTKADQIRIDNYFTGIALNTIKAITIIGHTDGDGSEDYNTTLSQRRVQRVYTYLIQKGIPAAKLRQKAVGESTPIASNTTAEGKRQNRCVEIVLE